MSMPLYAIACADAIAADLHIESVHRAPLEALTAPLAAALARWRYAYIVHVEDMPLTARSARRRADARGLGDHVAILTEDGERRVASLPSVRVTERELARVREDATGAGMTMSDWIRSRLTDGGDE